MMTSTQTSKSELRGTVEPVDHYDDDEEPADVMLGDFTVGYGQATGELTYGYVNDNDEWELYRVTNVTPEQFQAFERIAHSTPDEALAVAWLRRLTFHSVGDERLHWDRALRDARNTLNEDIQRVIGRVEPAKALQALEQAIAILCAAAPQDRA